MSEFLRVLVLNCRSDTHNSLDQVEILSGCLVLMSEIFRIVDVVGSAR